MAQGPRPPKNPLMPGDQIANLGQAERAAQLLEATTVSHKRLLRPKVSVTTRHVRIRITSSRLEPALAE